MGKLSDITTAVTDHPRPELKPIMKTLSFFALAATSVLADTPANCRYEQIVGTWDFHFTNSGQDNSISCVEGASQLNFNNTIQFELHDINKVTRLDDFNTQGFFTLIYNQGFEVIIDQRKWFAFFDYTASRRCDLTMSGWVHDVLTDDWACFYGEKAEVVSES